uniref:Uncharacterized protein n=1 Tax=Cacopsylla melanoneura TaxID=428564 RepID=A0A8D8RMA2_9HEMI
MSNLIRIVSFAVVLSSLETVRGNNCSSLKKVPGWFEIKYDELYTWTNNFSCPRGVEIDGFLQTFCCHNRDEVTAYCCDITGYAYSMGNSHRFLFAMTVFSCVFTVFYLLYTCCRVYRKCCKPRVVYVSNTVPSNGTSYENMRTNQQHLVHINYDALNSL